MIPTAGGRIAVACAVSSCCAWLAPSMAAEPPLKLIVPYVPGGAVDGTARIIATEMSNATGRNVVVENRPGASGMIAAEYLKRSPPDGSTLLIDTPAISMNPSVFRKPLYAPADVVPVAQIMSMPYLIAVAPGLQVQSYQDLVQRLKRAPGSMNAASSGTSSRLFAELFRLQTGTEFVNVNYSGAPPAILSVMKNESQLTAMDLANISSLVASGKLKGILVSGRERAPSLPDVPSAVEVGLPGYDVTTWYGIFAPGGTPPAVIDKLNGEIRAAIRTKAVTGFLKVRDGMPVDQPASAFAAFFNNEVARWRDVVREARIQQE
ncbi:tripartite tricarboxylate transporter substrate binding protein [Pigmentiphaga soli]|uniref:Tripartite tricarboxylate transporter substrate binding protein n=1 Tax=Pigmentiphaga soli TaxID=1007095 RepID=A0ABP8GKK6_9BURK